MNLLQLPSVVSSANFQVKRSLLCGARPSTAARRAQCCSTGQQESQAVGNAGPSEASTSGHQHLERRNGQAARRVAAAAAAAAVLLPACAAQATEAAPEGFLEFVIESIEALGPAGPAVFVVVVALAECIPLFPTQPLSLASGLLFGAQKGALCVLIGACLASMLAFSISRGVGRPLAERVIKAEMSGEGDEAGIVQRKLAEVQEAIERGSFWQQAGSVLLLRLTPIVPFSASNYVLGLSPLPLAPYLTGTFVGMAFWSVFYASLGGASRSLLLRGVDTDVLLSDLLERAGEYTSEIAAGAALLGSGALLYLGTQALRSTSAAAAVKAQHLESGGVKDDSGAAAVEDAAAPFKSAQQSLVSSRDKELAEARSKQ